ncbi:carboxylesterase family protein [Novosphingobium sp. SL115]|uniref:carboxylesterase/lipase family protein n=1 Tax=Novosphingobium sp. SL115 TaxID=2995150 RepID=UPI0022726115|nr:carboxylesterase family protein [Novosphingobium sp. SL115]MCY1672038.1 carboxylesterase family protein [Novosphingobium sp. SL115]
MLTLDRRRMLALSATVPAMGMFGQGWATVPADVVATSHGRVRGRTDGGIRVFTGIPYGRALRFGAPRSAPRWSGVLEATRPAPVAPQIPGMVPLTGTMSEDCLHLNIWAPAKAGRYPVLFYIHGGANEAGWSGEALTAGDRFAANGVVCVTVNYRVGALGFLDAGALLGKAYAGSANNAMRDLMLALRWVQANIAGFGGDPRKVTIAGGSAGGKNVGTLMGMPAADGLYAQVAQFSGGGQTVHTKADASAFARLFADKLGGAGRLLTASVEDILAAQGQAKAEWPHNFPFRPVVDGALLPSVPLERIRSGAGQAVPMLIGTNANESRLFVSAAQAAEPLRAQSIANESLARMEALDRYYAAAFPDLPDAERHWRLLTAEEYGMPCLRLAEGHAQRGAEVFRYRLAYPAPSGPFRGYSPHAFDTPFTFDHLNLPGLSAFFGLSAKDQPLADAVHMAVVNFVRSGRPSAPALPEWRPYTLDARETMVLDRASALVADPDRNERLIWAD